MTRKDTMIDFSTEPIATTQEVIDSIIAGLAGDGPGTVTMRAVGNGLRWGRVSQTAHDAYANLFEHFRTGVELHTILHRGVQ